MQPYGLQYARLPCPSPSPGVCCLVTRSCLTLCYPMDCSMPGQASLPFTIPQNLLTPMSIESMMPSNHLLLCCPPAFSLSRIRVLYNESALHIKWPKFWSFHFSISHSNKYSGLISSRIDKGFPDNSVGKESMCNAGDIGSIPGLRRPSREGIGHLLKYSCLENP